MTLDEAIIHCEEVAEENENQYKNCPMKYHGNYCNNGISAKRCANEHRQLAEWLRELKAYREARKEITRKMNSGQWSEAVVYGLDKAVRIMEKHLMEVNADEDSN